MIHHLETTQVLPAPLKECWDFFSHPRNLARITPAKLDFRILTELPEEMHAGLKIEYRVRPLLGIPVRWVSEITQVDPMRSFVDEQRAGPYKSWHHEHHFRPLDESSTEMRDSVAYELAFGPLGDLVHALVVRRQLRHIFDYRTRAVAEIFGKR
ncbi:MAG: SRPBCC family protein [Verrucomicrobiota bacterium]